MGILLDPIDRMYQITFEYIHLSRYVAICIDQKTEPPAIFRVKNQLGFSHCLAYYTIGSELVIKYVL